MNILDEIAAKTRERIQEEKRRIRRQILMEKIYERRERSAGQFRFYEALKKQGMSYICEVKKRLLPRG